MKFTYSWKTEELQERFLKLAEQEVAKNSLWNFLGIKTYLEDLKKHAYSYNEIDIEDRRNDEVHLLIDEVYPGREPFPDVHCVLRIAHRAHNENITVDTSFLIKDMHLWPRFEITKKYKELRPLLEEKVRANRAESKKKWEKVRMANPLANSNHEFTRVWLALASLMEENKELQSRVRGLEKELNAVKKQSAEDKSEMEKKLEKEDEARRAHAKYAWEAKQSALRTRYNYEHANHLPQTVFDTSNPGESYLMSWELKQLKIK
jgi:myosin heavy subunit